MQTTLIRPGRPDEAAELLDVMAAALAAETAAGALAHAFPDREREVAWLQYLLATGDARAAELGGRVSGFGITARRGAINWLVALFVRPEAQGQGLGRQMLEQ